MAVVPLALSQKEPHHCGSGTIGTRQKEPPWWWYHWHCQKEPHHCGSVPLALGKRNHHDGGIIGTLSKGTTVAVVPLALCERNHHGSCTMIACKALCKYCCYRCHQGLEWTATEHAPWVTMRHPHVENHWYCYAM